jgi:DNA polymerase-3 subunit epsilon
LGFFGRLFGGGKEEPSGPPASVNLVSRARFVVIDTELTGLDPRKDDIVSIGALKMRGGRIEVGQTFHEFVRPEADMRAKSVVIHGITASELEAKPPIEMVFPRFVDFVDTGILVGHCLPIDMSFLDRESKRLAGAAMPNPLVDTLSLYGWLRNRRAVHPIFSSPLKDLRLYDMARSFGISVEGAHDALGDAFITAQLFQRFLPILDGFGVREVEDLLRVGDPGIQGATFFNPGGRVGF